MPRRALYPIITIVLLLAACRADRPPTPIPIETEADFLNALETAGVEVDYTALAGWGQFGTPGRAFQVDQSLVYVYEYDDAAEANTVIDQLAVDASSLGGVDLPWHSSPHIWQTGRIIVTYDGGDGGTILLLSGLMGDFVNRPIQGTDEPYPPAVAVVIAKFLDIRHLEPDEVEVIGFEFTTWPDGCLGMPGPDEACTEAEVPGWNITLQIGEEVLEVHTDEFGIEVRWEQLEEE